jgi:hypothetical protein
MAGIAKLLANVQSRSWKDLLRDWERFLRAANRSESTRYGYLLTACRLAAYLADEMPGSGSDRDPSLVTRRHIIAFQAWMFETRSSGWRKKVKCCARRWAACRCRTLARS